MNILERYIFRTVATGFVLALAVLTAIVWVTQALKEINILTSHGQTLWLFLYLTALALPALVNVISPIALFIACLYTLNKLNADSELVVINAAGAPRWLVAKPFIIMGILVTAMSAYIALSLVPHTGRLLRDTITNIRADVVANLVAEGQFTAVEQDLTFHIRDRRPDGTLLGLLVHDEREPLKIMTYLAEEGRIVRTDDNAYLVMENGSLQQREDRPDKISIVRFDRYVFDLSNMSGSTVGPMFYHPREMRMSELLTPDQENPLFQQFPGRFRQELHERVSSILWPLTFVMITLTVLVSPRSNRQGRGSALMIAIAAVGVVRILGFSASNLSATRAWAVIPMYALPLAALGLAIWFTLIQRGRLDSLLERITLPRPRWSWLDPRQTIGRLITRRAPRRRVAAE